MQRLSSDTIKSVSDRIFENYLKEFISGMDLYFCCLLENGDADVGMSCLERKLNRFPWISLEIWRVRTIKIVHENNFYVT